MSDKALIKRLETKIKNQRIALENQINCTKKKQDELDSLCRGDGEQLSLKKSVSSQDRVISRQRVLINELELKIEQLERDIKSYDALRDTVNRLTAENGRYLKKIKRLENKK